MVVKKPVLSTVVGCVAPPLVGVERFRWVIGTARSGGER